MNYNEYSEGGFQADELFSGGSQKTQFRLSITPVTIKQLQDATQPVPDGEWVVHNVKLNMVSIVGILRNITNGDSYVSMIIEDGTGGFDLRKWMNSEDPSAPLEYEKLAPLEGKYVTVCGTIKQQGERKNMVQPNIRAIEDHNELVYHHLLAISVHLQAQGTTFSGDKLLFVADTNTSASGPNKIYNFIRERSQAMPEGVPAALVAQEFGMDLTKVIDELNESISNGDIYEGHEPYTYIVF